MSSAYVERRGGIKELLAGAGKRAAFALYYGALHFLTVREVVRALAAPGLRSIQDLGCGTGTSGAAWALEVGARYEGVERSAWAVEEARHTLASLRLPGRVVRGDLRQSALGEAGAGILLAYAVNELAERARAALLDRLIAAHARGASLLVVEPIARRAAPWWDDWVVPLRRGGARPAPWRFRCALPPILALLDRASGLDHRELTARTLWLAPRGDR